jgi:CelD/BcsL family acetyltransferase involved in cellulose biosynthesis
VIERIETADRFDAMRDEWTDLLSDSSADSPFLTWEWLNAWWAHLREERRLMLLAVRDENRLIAIAPLAEARGRLPFFCRGELLGTGFAGSDYLDAIVRRGWEWDAVQSLAGHIRARNTAMHLDHLRPGSVLARVVPSLGESGWTVRQADHGVCPFIRLAGHTWDSFLGTIGPAQRATTRRRLRTLQQKFDMKFGLVTAEAAREAALARLFAFHEERWGSRGTAFHTPALRAFHLDFTRRAQQAGWLRLYTLHLNGELAAVMYGFAFKGRFYFYQHGYDPRFQSLGVGRAALDLSIRSAIDERLGEFDLLYGSETYKSAWTAERRSLARIDLFPAHLAGRIHQRAVDTERTLRAFARRMLSAHAPQAS